MPAATPRQGVIAGDHGFLQLSMSGGSADQHHMPTIAQLGNCRIGLFQVDKTLPLHFQQFGIEAQVFGHAQEFGRRDFVKAQIIFMQETISGQLYLVFTGNDRKTDESGVDSLKIKDPAS